MKWFRACQLSDEPLKPKVSPSIVRPLDSSTQGDFPTLIVTTSQRPDFRVADEPDYDRRTFTAGVLGPLNEN